MTFPALTLHRLGPALAALALLLAVPAVGPAAHAQNDAPPAASSALPEDSRAAGRRAQARFETFRRANLSQFRGNHPGNNCQERVGRFCYWYDEDGPPPAPESPRVTEARLELVRQLDSLTHNNPSDPWLNGQRVRYLDEAGLNQEALAAAQECEAFGWWCDALEGFALHQLGRYADAEVAFARVLEQMTSGERCMWRDISLYLDQDSRRLYDRNSCGTAEREAFEARVWWLARTRYGMDGNDSRSEHFARMTYAQFLEDAPSAHMFGFDPDERELLLRFGWPRKWSAGPPLRGPSIGGPTQITRSIIGHDPTPAYRYIPPMYVLTSPTVSDSTDWAVQLPPVVARYQPPYATRLLMLEHQQGLFRRGDTALVVLAYDVSKVEGLGGAPLEAALVLTPGGVPDPSTVVQRNAPARGTLSVRAPWGPLLMSAELAAPSVSTLVRARYGIRPPFAVGTRVTLSDLLFYTPYGEFPDRVEDALPHAIPTQRVRANEKLGVFWEAYNTNPAGERMTVSLTVVPETVEAGLLRRAARALRLARESAPVSVTVEDLSRRGATWTGRSLELDISTLVPGEYLVQLEISVAGQYTIRTDRRLVVVTPD